VYYTHRPLEWEDWLETNHPGQYQKLKTKALTYKRINWKTEAQKWKTKIK